MSPALDNPYLSAAARVLVGALFVFASIEKAADPAAFAILIDNYRLLPPSVSIVVASILPWVELTCGVALLFGLSHRGAALLIGAMTLLFTAAIISGIARELDISCGCFTLDPDVSRIGWRKVAENLGIVVLSVFLIYSRGDAWTVSRLSETAERDDRPS